MITILKLDFTINDLKMCLSKHIFGFFNLSPENQNSSYGQFREYFQVQLNEMILLRSILNLNLKTNYTLSANILSSQFNENVKRLSSSFAMRLLICRGCNSMLPGIPRKILNYKVNQFRFKIKLYGKISPEVRIITEFMQFFIDKARIYNNSNSMGIFHLVLDSLSLKNF